jgi:hypothetical protein
MANGNGATKVEAPQDSVSLLLGEEEGGKVGGEGVRLIPGAFPYLFIAWLR